ncbi:DUF4960 domain-containing protein [Dysgonomonas sp. 521]|uniref:DUF4960 domain-containing protein n=1 Tax=Dysgonomonas sp. 521 TaxID=2302932 RepID=UPI0013D591A7|nr:DUF4960 domain-containing protein [Dysgonomonas sp. 521]NDV96868.1 DUF4960 domain-containing protein [Dysgonomonas sp. 521]
MKKAIYYLIPFVFTLFLGLNFTSCSDDDHPALDVSGETKILSFKVDGTEGAIDETGNTITVMLPQTADLTKLTPQIETSPGATVTPQGGAEIDLSKMTTFRVVNGNLYSDYKVVAAHIIGKFMAFNIGKYKGTIDNEAKTIHIRYPKTEDVTKLIPEFTVTEGAAVSPESGQAVDFSKPVKYTISYMGQTFEYTVTVEKADIKPIGYLGVYNTGDAIDNEDEKAAYSWLVNNMPDVQYISFNDIKNGTVNLDEFAVLWWYTDGSTRSLPTVATESAITTSLKAYYANGGSFFFSSWAVQYAATLGIPKDGKPANNMWGESNSASQVELGDDWGICFTGNESHPVFRGLNTPVGVNNKVYLLGKGIKVKAHNAIWNFVEDWVEYKSAGDWSAASGGVCLGSFHWDDSGKERAVIFEYPKEGTSGATVCIGSEAYDWSVDGTNTLQGNLEQLTTNILNYLSN